jgi:hypothetical protein
MGKLIGDQLSVIITLAGLDTFGTPKRVCSQFPFPRLGFGTCTGSGASRLTAPIRRHHDADRAVNPLIVAAASTTTFPFHAKYNSQAWEMGTENKPFSVCQRCLLTWLHHLSVCSFRCGKTVWGHSWLSSIFTRQKSWKGDRPHPHPCLAKILHKGSVHAFSSGSSCECWEYFSQRFG